MWGVVDGSTVATFEYLFVVLGGCERGAIGAVAAQGAGVSRPTGCRWFSGHQKVLPSPVQDFSVARVGLLSLRERQEIEFQLARGHGVRRIAAALGRAPSTISREVARNQVTCRYVPSLAQEQTWARARRPRAQKLDGLALRDRVTTGQWAVRVSDQGPGLGPSW
ncbi:hypothetical protein E3O65_05610 [Cryobacterium breve]|uniref:Transposase IS30-like HTH domain-containing protein n=1 Tax=Cryobacterium breve TaxID=1259258 RepID=A0ABY2J6W4_9MICO|nr:hypothetical protein E3T20_11655 [Cryobacterium sp. TmT3-12]TFC99626.1 hypothetical protein E3O65_05610 [Cryobacterium breve]